MNIKTILEKYIGREVGANLERPMSIDTVTLTSVEEDYFSIKNEADGNECIVPYFNIVNLTENPDGVSVHGLFKSHKSHPLVIKIGHVIEYGIH